MRQVAFDNDESSETKLQIEGIFSHSIAWLLILWSLNVGQLARASDEHFRVQDLGC